MAYYDDMCEIWDIVRESFHDKLSSETIKLWFGSVKIVSFTGRELTMSVPSSLRYDVIKSKYIDEIGRRFSKILGLISTSCSYLKITTASPSSAATEKRRISSARPCRPSTSSIHSTIS